MATKMLESSAVSAFCESVAVMHSAGIQMDEAVFLLGENMEDAAFKRACDDVYKELIVGKPLALAMDDSGCFPSHVVDMAGAGEHAGRLENVLWSLARYYDEEDRLYAKIKNAIAYPAALLCVMSAILLFTVIVILPVFVDVYHGLLVFRKDRKVRPANSPARHRKSPRHISGKQRFHKLGKFDLFFLKDLVHHLIHITKIHLVYPFPCGLRDCFLLRLFCCFCPDGSPHQENP